MQQRDENNLTNQSRDNLNIRNEVSGSQPSQQSTLPTTKVEPEAESKLDQPEPYTTFTKRQKWILVFLVSVAATFSGFASNIYFPALPTIAKDLDISTTLVNLTVTSYLIFQGLAPSLWGAVADVKGRRLAYICTFTVFLGACIGLANTQNYATLITLRCLQSTGSASTIALGAGVIGDITTRAERGGYMGIFQSGLLAPVAIGPIIGGAIATSLGWRAIFWFLAVYSGVVLLGLMFAFPETLRSIVGNGSRTPTHKYLRHPLQFYQKFQDRTDSQEGGGSALPKKSIDLFSPFRILISNQAVLVISFLSIYYTVWQISITVMSTLFKSVYGLTETEIGLTFIANGVGSIIGTLTTSKILDADYRRMKASFDAQNHPETQSTTQFPIERARLRLVPIFALLQCASIIVFGWTMQYRIQIAAPIATTFVTGWTAVSIQSVTMTYLVDIFHDNSASASAALNIGRCLLSAGGTAAANPIIQGLGIGGCFTLLTGLMLLGLGLIWGQAWLNRRSGKSKEVHSTSSSTPNRKHEA